MSQSRYREADRLERLATRAYLEAPKDDPEARRQQVKRSAELAEESQRIRRNLWTGRK